MADYQFWISDEEGVRLAPLVHLESAIYTRTVNDWGWCKERFPLNKFDEALIGVDHILEIERRPRVGVAYTTEWVGFLRKWRRFDADNGEPMIELGAMHMAELLDRRLIAFKTDTAQADKSGPADDVMKAFVRENAGNLAPLDEAGRPRDYGTEFSVQADASLGPTVDRQGGWKNLLQTLQQISLSSIPQTPAIYFDIVYAFAGGLATFEFRTYSGQVGTDRSTGLDRVIFSKARENLRAPVYEVDWSQERNYIYGLGPGIGVNRIVDPEKDVPRHTLTKWSRREDYQDARGETDVLGVASRAFEKLQASRPRERFTAELLDTPQHPYGEEWFFGDKAVAEYLSKQFTGNIESVAVEIKPDGSDSISARIESDSYATS